MLFSATFNNISVISWWSVLLVDETRSPRRKPPTCRKSLTNFITVLYRLHLVMDGIRTTLVLIGTDCTGSCKSNYYTIAITTAPDFILDYSYRLCVYIIFFRFVFSTNTVGAVVAVIVW